MKNIPKSFKMLLTVTIVSFAILISTLLDTHVFAVDDTKITLGGNQNPIFGEQYIYHANITGQVQDHGFTTLYSCVAGQDLCFDPNSQLYRYEESTGYVNHWGVDFTVTFSEIGHQSGKPFWLIAKNGNYESSLLVTATTPIPAQTQSPIIRNHIPVIHLIEIIPRTMTDRWIAVVDICAGDQTLYKPTMIIKSDLDSVTFTEDVLLGAGSCSGGEMYDIKAKDPTSIVVQFQDQSNSESPTIPEFPFAAIVLIIATFSIVLIQKLDILRTTL